MRPAGLFGLETVTLIKRQELELKVAELKMLRFSLGATRMDRMRNGRVGHFGARLRWFGHVQRRRGGTEYTLVERY